MPFNIVIGGPGSPTVRGAVVTAITLGPALPNGNRTVNLAIEGTTVTVAVGERVSMAAAIGTGAKIDLANTGTPIDFPLQNQPSGVLANGGAWLRGPIELSRLQKYGTKIMTSGVVALDSDSKPVPQSDDVATAGTLVSSAGLTNGPAFPGDFIPATGVSRFSLIDDAWNRNSTNSIGLSYTSATTRTVEPFEPAQLDSKGNLKRYRGLARDGANGIYIGNVGQTEKLGTGTQTMSRAELLTMWLSTTTDSYTRNGNAATAGSLEERHLRGWVGPDEFLPRGALVELLPGGPSSDPSNPYIRVTFDPRSDAVPNGPDPGNAARDANGVSLPGVYTKDYVWPKDGVLFAEGNMRIRGKVNLPAAPPNGAPDPYPSLTVVSMGNLYIEGAVSVDSTTPNPNRKKLLLLAKENVVVNPTRLALGHVDAQTISINTAPVAVTPGTPIDIPVSNADVYRVGDVVETYEPAPAASTLGVRGVITAINPPDAPATPPAGKLNVSVIAGTTVTPGSSVKTLLNDTKPVVTPTATVTPAPPPVPPHYTVDAERAISRRVLLADANNYPNLRLTLDHYGERKPVFEVKTEAVAPLPKPADLRVLLSNRRTSTPPTPFVASLTQVSPAEKYVNGEYNLPAAGSDTFRATTFATQADVDAYSLTSLSNDMNAVVHPSPAINPTANWKYTTTITDATAAGLPFYYLAGVGLRYDPTLLDNDGAAIDPADPNTWRQNVGGTKEYNIPLAASVSFLRNNASVLPQPSDAASLAVTAPYLGFSPLFLPTLLPPDAALEDRLTVDQSFYPTDPQNSTLDSRKLLDSTGTSALATNDALTLRQTQLTLPTDATLPEYRVNAVKLENSDITAATPTIEPLPMEIDAYIYAQNGSWFVIPGGYFKENSKVRGITDGNGEIIGSYLDKLNPNVPDPGEYVLTNPSDPNSTKVADLNRNGIADPGEKEAAIRFLRYNYQINFFGAIVENETARVDEDVAQWMDKMANYDSTATGATGPKWKFISYAYDRSLADNTPESRSLRVPQTPTLLYQQ